MTKRIFFAILSVVAILMITAHADAGGRRRHHHYYQQYPSYNYNRGCQYAGGCDYFGRPLYGYGDYYPGYSRAVVYQQPVVVRQTKLGLLDVVLWPVNKTAELIFGQFEIADSNAPACAPNDAGCRRRVAREEGRFDGQVETADVAEEDGYREGRANTAPRKPGEGY